MFNKYGVSGTFNLVSDQNLLQNADEARKAQVREMYSGQEIANHVKKHPHMDSTFVVGPQAIYVGTSAEFIKCIEDGKTELEEIFGEGSIQGMAWPYNDPTVYLANPDEEAQRVSDYVLNESPYKYVRRSDSSGSFALPENFKEWKFTTHFKSIDTFGEQFLEEPSGDELRLLSVWGHSYEFANTSTPISLIDDFLADAVAQGVWVATNVEVVDYVTAMRKAQITDDSIINNSDMELYFVLGYNQVTVPAHSTYKYRTPTIYLAGDSTCEDYPEDDTPIPGIMGWGTKFIDKVTIPVDNRAKRNMSTVTFKDAYDNLIADAKSGDYVFIQFGHNDSMTNRPERYCTIEEFKENLTGYVNKAEAKGVIPVFLTATRGIYGFTDYTMQDDAVDLYRNAMKELGAELGVITLDVAEAHRTFLKTLTKQEALTYYLDGDVTHFNEKGAELFAQIVVDEIKKNTELGLGEYIK